MVKPYSQPVIEKLKELIANGISMVKENAVTCMATVAEQLEKDFGPYFQPALTFLSEQLNLYTSAEYK